MMDYLDVKRDDINYVHLYGEATHLMENAAIGIRDAVRKVASPGSRICAVCGTGNNGGDGIAALEKLRGEYEVVAVLLKGKDSLKTPESRWALKNYKGVTEGPDSLEKNLKESDLIIDAIFGIGISGEPREPYASAIRSINSIGKPVISVDIPSGLGTSHQVKSTVTVTFTDVKNGMDKNNSGEIVVHDIGIPEKVARYAGPGDLVYYAEPKAESHKGMNGTLSILGGWEFYGSAVIAGLAALRMATDLVRIYTTSTNYRIIASYSPYLIVRNLRSNAEGWLKEASGHGAVLIGPGMGTRQPSKSAMASLIERSTSPLVIDADGIKLVGKSIGIVKGKTVVFTPHHKEFEILSGEKANEENAIAFAKQHSVTVVLKGRTDIVTNGTKTICVEGGNPRMTMGGTGDMLAGLIAACASRGIEPFRSAVMGAYVNKKAGELAYDRKSYWYSIDDMLESIPELMKNEIKWASQNK